MNRSLLLAALSELDAVRFDDAPIPKRLHMTARSKVLSHDVGSNLAHIQDQNPDWSIAIYDDDDIESFLAQQFGPHVQRIYLMINKRYGAARADLFRYLCVFRLGGIYLDLKSTTTTPLDDWIRPSDRFILSQWDNGPEGKYSDWGLHKKIQHIAGGEYQQWFVASSVGHPYLRAVCEQVLRNILGHSPIPARFGRPGVLEITGPIAYTQAIHPIRHQHPHRFMDVEQEGGLLYSFYASQVDHFKLSATHYSVLQEPIVQLPGMRKHLFELSRFLQGCWQDGKQNMTTKMVQLKRLVKGQR